MPVTVQVAYGVLPEGLINWGQIGGDLSNQADLMALLNGKASSTHTHTLASITNITVGAVAPANPTLYDIWIDTN